MMIGNKNELASAKFLFQKSKPIPLSILLDGMVSITKSSIVGVSKIEK